MPIASMSQWPWLGNSSRLAQSEESIIFPENCNDRPIPSGLTANSRRHAGDLLQNAEAFGFDHSSMLGRGAELLKIQFRSAPNAIAEIAIALAPSVHVSRNRLIPHG